MAFSEGVSEGVQEDKASPVLLVLLILLLPIGPSFGQHALHGVLDIDVGHICEDSGQRPVVRSPDRICHKISMNVLHASVLQKSSYISSTKNPATAIMAFMASQGLSLVATRHPPKHHVQPRAVDSFGHFHLTERSIALYWAVSCCTVDLAITVE